MPRTHRHFLAGQVWHVTHRRHERAFLLKFARDRRRHLQWLFEAKKRFGLCVLDYMVTCNHIHLLLKDDGSDVIIARSMKLVAGRTAQEFNQRKTRKQNLKGQSLKSLARACSRQCLQRQFPVPNCLAKRKSRVAFPRNTCISKGYAGPTRA